MDEVWNRKYERGPIRIDSILSIYARMEPQEREVHTGWIDVVPDLELQRSRTTMPGRMGDMALRRHPSEILARTAQTAPNSRMNSPYDLAHGAPELPEAAHARPIRPCMGFRSMPLDANLHLHLQPSTSSGGTS